MYLLDGTAAHADDLAQLGPHTTAVSCVYIRDVAAIDLAVLERIVAASYRTISARG